MLTIVIPTFNPNIHEFDKALKSALDISFAKILIVDDCSDEIFKNYLKSIEEECVKIVFNKVRLGASRNSINSLSLASTKYVKKLDPDDFLYSNSFKEKYFKGEQKIIFTKYIYKRRKKNNKRDYLTWDYFNGSSIYLTSEVKKFQSEFQKIPMHYFDDVLLIDFILSKSKFNEILFINDRLYNYGNISTTLPSQILLNYEDWKLGFEIQKEIFNLEINDNNSKKIIKNNLTKSYILNDILKPERKICIPNEFKNNSIYFKLSFFIRKIISKIVLFFY